MTGTEDVRLAVYRQLAMTGSSPPAQDVRPAAATPV
jgi:hypothetical protein